MQMRQGNRVGLAALGLVMGTAVGVGSAETTEVSLAVRPGTEQLYNALIADFESTNPNIEVDLLPVSGSWVDTLSIRFASGAGPDIVSFPGDEMAAFMSQGRFVNLAPYLKRDGIDESSYLPLQVDSFDGTRYGLGVYWGPVIMGINSDLFREQGLAEPGTGWTWDQLLADGKKLTLDRNGDGTLDQYGYYAQMYTWTWHAKVSGWGGTLFDRTLLPTKSTINSPETVAAMQWFADLINVYHVSPPYGAKDMFNQGQVAIDELGPWQIPAYQTAIGKSFHWQIAPWPQGPKGGGPRYASEIMAINADSHSPEAAWQFLKYAASDRGQRIMIETQGAVPSRRDTALNVWVKSVPNLNLSAFFDASADIIRRPYTPKQGAIDPINSAEFDPVWRGTRSAQSAADAAKPRIDAVLAG